MKISDYVIDFLALNGITHIFEVCGGALAHLLDSVYGREDITTVSMHHEMAAAIAAEGYSRVGGNFGVAMATSGPGATNLITGIGSCYFDSVPCLFITGQVNTYEYKFDKPVRQIGFQETDIVSIVRPVVKKATLIDDGKNIRFLLEEAYFLMRNGRPGPVLLDIPLNIQRGVENPHELLGYSPKRPATIPPISGECIEQVTDLIWYAHRPIILAGGGIRSSHACQELLEFAHKTKIPVVTSLMGLDSFPHDDSLFAGMIGTYGNRYANLSIANADLVIALGTRLDTRQTGTRPSTFARKAKMVHVDIDPTELDNKLPAFISICTDVRHFLRSIMNHPAAEKNGVGNGEWQALIGGWKQRYPDFRPPSGPEIDPNYFMNVLSGILRSDTITCVDVGQIQMWAAQSLRIRQGQRFITEGGMASIGSALPLAIGASFAKPGSPVIAITGDGGFQLNIQELQTIFHHQLPVKIILLNNNGYGMIRQFQEQYFNSRFQSSEIGYSNPDFLEVVKSYKIASDRVSCNEDLPRSLKRFLSDSKPGFLEVIISPGTRVTPKLAVNRPVEDQEPLLDRDELKSNMLIDLLPELE
jgi:acetolactate synthase I/II/III large subunit